LGNYRVSVNGANFAPDSQALADGVAVATTFVSSTSLVVNGTAAQVGTIQFAVRQPGPGAVTGNSVSASVTAAIVEVTVTPTTAIVQLGNSQTFAAKCDGVGPTDGGLRVGGHYLHESGTRRGSGCLAATRAAERRVIGH
jgi:hypothetical protein